MRRYYPPENFMEIGLMLMQRVSLLSSDTNERRFRALFGTNSHNCSRIWSLIEVDDDGARPVHLLWALMFLKVYAAEEVNATIAGVHEDTFRKWSWLFTKAIFNLHWRVILWENRLRGDVGNTCKISVDGTDFRILNRTPFWKGWFSFKFKTAGLRYEVGVNIMTGDIVWIEGPHPAGKMPDITIFRLRLKHVLPDGEKVIADKGYRGEPNKVVIDHPDAQKVRSRHETVNRRFKQFNILGRTFRHSPDLHQAVFIAVAVIVQLGMEESPLYQVEYSE